MRGLIYVFTGDGKGKTSAALGVATRALLLGEKVGWVAFYKGKDWDVAEKKMTEKFSNLTMVFSGEGFKITQKSKLKNQNDDSKLKVAEIVGGNIVVDKASDEEHKEAARQGLEIARDVLSRKSSDHSPIAAQGSELGEQRSFLLVMDEVLNAVSEGLIEENKVLEVLAKRGSTHVVLTGRGVTEKIVEKADLVTECKKIKHPYEIGKLAVRGLDY